MDRTTCSRYETCNAMLCPLDKDIGKPSWFPEEDICRLKKYWTLRWVKSQKKIKKKAKDIRKYYLYVMLNRKFVITGAITGLDPEKDKKPQLRAWLKAHPELKPPSKRKLEAMKKARMKSPLQRGHGHDFERQTVTIQNVKQGDPSGLTDP